MRWVPADTSHNPRAHQDPPYALRVAAGRPEGIYRDLDEAIYAAEQRLAAAPANWDGSIYVVTYDGSWIVGRVAR